ncbi:outer membrane protein [Maribacter sp. 4G9]|uniref:outer membrane protein n=1 Tax=Maribacter sp. 4G9 TaxID=1889777 RepID=UPI000C14875D|nr:outer membrane beta-barrel protein [Maribacter sp. 4G9]PIB23349.1 hypothetical protein BFP75_10080 [Maribacter sp. 4G9]
MIRNLILTKCKKTYLVFLVVFITVNSLISQESNFSLSLNYPLTNGDNYFDRNDGLIDLGVQYRFIDAGVVDLGISLNAAFFNFSSDSGLTTTTEKSLLLQPRLFAEFNIPAVQKLQPFLGLGYALTSFKNEFSTSQQVINNDSNSGGLNFNFGLSYYIFKGLFVQGQYDYISSKREEGTVPDPDEKFYQKIGLIKLGVGYRF